MVNGSLTPLRQGRLSLYHRARANETAFTWFPLLQPRHKLLERSVSQEWWPSHSRPCRTRCSHSNDPSSPRRTFTRMSRLGLSSQERKLEDGTRRALMTGQSFKNDVLLPAHFQDPSHHCGREPSVPTHKLGPLDFHSRPGPSTRYATKGRWTNKRSLPLQSNGTT